MTHVVVNKLHFREPVTDQFVRAAEKAVRQVVDAGGIAARILKVDETHLILLLEFDSAEDAARIATEIGGPWMREHVVPLLARDTDRSVGEVIVSVEAR